jgi:hypothetical protein
MAHGRKQAISLRVSSADLRKVKKLAQRLGARDSDVIRFALKTMLARLGPLCDQAVRGRALLPVFIDAGSDLLNHFDLDAAHLEEIVNAGAGKDQAVEPNDLQLLAMAGFQQTYVKFRFNKMTTGPAGERPALDLEDPLNGRLRGYLYSKYIDEEPASDASTE